MPPPETSAEIREAIVAAEAYVVAAGARIELLAARRRTALVNGSTADVVAVEAEQREAAVDVERARLRLEALEERHCAAQAAERDAAAEREREELAAVCRARLDVAERVDAAIAELAAAVAEWESLGREVTRRWTVGGHLDRHGALTPDFVDPTYPVRGAVPPALALTLRMSPAVDPVHGPRPVAQTDPAAAALARLKAGPPPHEQAAPPREEPAGPSIRIGAVPPRLPPDPPPRPRGVDLFLGRA